MCVAIVIWLSKITPRLRTLSVGLMAAKGEYAGSPIIYSYTQFLKKVVLIHAFQVKLLTLTHTETKTWGVCPCLYVAPTCCSGGRELSIQRNDSFAKRKGQSSMILFHPAVTWLHHFQNATLIPCIPSEIAHTDSHRYKDTNTRGVKKKRDWV